MDSDFETISFGFLTVSDTCFRNKLRDKSGPAAISLIQNAGFNVSFYDCILDDSELINSIILNWIESKKVNVIITLGGTGISPRDVTSESLAKLISDNHRLSGIEHLLYSVSLKKTLMSALSRFVAGFRDEVILISLPGSCNAVSECIPVILPLMKHAVAVLKNWQGLIKQEHLSQYNESVDHNQNVNFVDFQLDIVNRPRQSQYPMISVDEALEKIFKVTDSILVGNIIIEAVHYTRVLGRVIGVDLKVQQCIPPFNASVMDGYAINITGGIVNKYKVLGSICAGDNTFDCSTMLVDRGMCVRVNTGCFIPPGANAVIPVEQTKLVSTIERNGCIEEDIIEILELSVKSGQFIRNKGCDLSESFVFKRGSVVNHINLGMMSSAGLLAPWMNLSDFVLEMDQISLFVNDLALLKNGGYLPCLKQPVIGIFSTGNELVDSTHFGSNDCIRDSNRPLILSLLRSIGFLNIFDFGIIKDDYKDLHEVFQKAFKLCDVLITTGGVSMGDRDLVTFILKTNFEATIHFGRIFMKPGKPTTFLTVPRLDSNYFKQTAVVFSLPGNPVSAYVTTHLFVLPFLRKLSFKPIDQCSFPKINVSLLHSVKLGDRPEYRRGKLVWSNSKDNAQSLPGAQCDHVGNQMSSCLTSCLDSNLLVLLPPANDDLQELPCETIVPALIIGELS